MSSHLVHSRVDTSNGAANGVKTKSVVTKADVRNGGHYGATLLRDKVQSVSHKCRSRIGLSASEISEFSPTVDSFFDAVAAERLRWMPRDGSRLDATLRRASRLAYAVNSLRESVMKFAAGADDAAKLIWGCSLLLLLVSFFCSDFNHGLK